MKNRENENKKKRLKRSDVKFHDTKLVPDTVHRD